VKYFYFQKIFPHSPQRFENTVGLVVEYQREPGALDAFQWYCDECNEMIHEVTLDLENIVTQLPPLFDAYWNNIKDRTCGSCGAIQEKP